MIDLRHGFFRLTVVVSLIAGGLSIYLSRHRPTFEEFRTRQATVEEKMKADEWWTAKAQPQPSPAPSPDSAFNNLVRDWDDPLANAKLNDQETALRSIHFGERIQRDYQAVMPIAFVLRYYTWPFGVGVAAVWLIYAVIFFVVQGFRRA